MLFKIAKSLFNTHYREDSLVKLALFCKWTSLDVLTDGHSLYNSRAIKNNALLEVLITEVCVENII